MRSAKVGAVSRQTVRSAGLSQFNLQTFWRFKNSPEKPGREHTLTDRSKYLACPLFAYSDGNDSDRNIM